MTTVRLPTDEIGGEAAITILDLARREREPLPPAQATMLPVSLVVRGTTAPPGSIVR